MTETPEPFGIERARELLKAAVETQGRDFVYNPQDVLFPCRNSPMTAGEVLGSFGGDGKWVEITLAADDPRVKTGCIVGTALTLGGYTYHTDVSYNGQSATTCRKRFVDFNLVAVYTLDAAHYFSVAQREQDRGSTWGQAYDAAERWYAENRGTK